ncbi:MAG: hypothetical protein JWP97_4223 [Labilithrix sp.]|nr:hypothetical protein [Labilithrix sp.]
MSFVARAEILIDAPVERVFERLADLAAWPSWMPGSFVPVFHGKPEPLALGTRFRVKVGGSPLPASLRVSLHERPRQLAWTGGVPGLLRAEHRFVVEAEGPQRSRVRSVETWTGALALAGITKRIVKPLAEKIGRAQLAGLARAAALTN